MYWQTNLFLNQSSALITEPVILTPRLITIYWIYHGPCTSWVKLQFSKQTLRITNCSNHLLCPSGISSWTKHQNPFLNQPAESFPEPISGIIPWTNLQNPESTSRIISWTNLQNHFLHQPPESLPEPTSRIISWTFRISWTILKNYFLNQP